MESRKHEYLHEAQRRESFKHWPFAETEVCSVVKMAEAGFFWCGTVAEPDSAACFLCGKVLDNWEADDDPWFEHRKHAPQCLFATLGKREKQLTLDEFLSVQEKMGIDELDRQKQRDVQKVRQRAQTARDELTKYFRQQ